MRMPQEIRVRPGSQKSSSTSVPAPIGGLNVRDSVANMPIQDAVVMENWFPSTTSADVRNGYTAWSTFTGLCQGIIVYKGISATKVFPCVKNGSTYSIFEGTSAGALSTAVVGGGGATVQALTSTRYDHQNFGTTGGEFISAVNGTDVPLQYDGTTWIASTMTNGTPASFFTVGVYGTRLWYVPNNSRSVYYQQLAAITGATTQYNLGPVLKEGGYINSIITVTDSANTLADYIVFLTSEGELVAYTGDPASTFTRVAQFRIGRPVCRGNNCWVKWGADALVLCADGVYPIRKAIEANKTDDLLAVSDKIRPLLNGDLIAHGAKKGWTLKVHPTGAKLVVNVPYNEDSVSYQYVMNTQTGAWTKFTGWSAFCFEVALDTLWMGMSGKMVKADLGTADGTADISFDCRQAYNYFNTRGRAKHAKLIRPILAADGEYTLGIRIDTDYATTPLTNQRTVGDGGGDPWGGVWDVAWSGAMEGSLKWYSATGLGHALSFHFNGAVNGTRFTWSATDFVYEVGGILA